MRHYARCLDERIMEWYLLWSLALNLLKLKNVITLHCLGWMVTPQLSLRTEGLG